MRAGEGEATGDVVVVQVRLDDVGEAQAALVQDGEQAVEVALRVDDHRHGAVVHQVGPVAQRRRRHGDDDQLASLRTEGQVSPGVDPGERAAGDRSRLDAAVEQRVGDRTAAVARAADHEHGTVRRDLREVDLGGRREQGPGDVARGVLVGLPDVEQQDLVATGGELVDVDLGGGSGGHRDVSFVVGGVRRVQP